MVAAFTLLNYLVHSVAVFLRELINVALLGLLLALVLLAIRGCWALNIRLRQWAEDFQAVN